MKLCRTVAFGIALSTLSHLTTPAEVKSAVKKTESAAQGALRSAVMLRLDRTDATDTTSSDKGSLLVIAELEQVVEDYAILVSRLGNGAAQDEVAPVKFALENILSLMPKTNTAFNRIIQPNSQTAPLLVEGLRRIIKRALNISSTRAELRVHALNLLIERMESHGSLASGPNGPVFLSTFSIWLAELTGWRYSETAPGRNSVTPAEMERVARSDALYQQAFNAMRCSKLFSMSPAAKPKSR